MGERKKRPFFVFFNDHIEQEENYLKCRTIHDEIDKRRENAMQEMRKTSYLRNDRPGVANVFNCCCCFLIVVVVLFVTLNCP